MESKPLAGIVRWSLQQQQHKPLAGGGLVGYLGSRALGLGLSGWGASHWQELVVGRFNSSSTKHFEVWSRA